MTEKTKKSLDTDELKKKYGLVIASELQDCEKLPTGLFTLDEILGAGIPLGRLMSIHGMQSTGKSLLAAYIASKFQQTQEKPVLWIDAENSIEPGFYEKLGVDVDALEVKPVDGTAEESLDMIIELSRAGIYSLIVLDSIAALVPKNELESALEDAKMTELARVLSRATRIIASECAKTKTTVILLNQVRESLNPYGPKTTLPGGNALKFFTSVMLELKKGEIYYGDEKYADGEKKAIGNQIKIEAKKNKVGVPGASGSINIYYNTGVDYIADAFNIATNKGIIIQTGNSYSYKEVKLGVGKEKAIAKLKEDTILYDEIYKELEKTLIK